MSDVYELGISVDLRDEVSEQELDELRWHLGIGPQPARLSIVTGFPFVAEEESGASWSRTILVHCWPVVAWPGVWAASSALRWPTAHTCPGRAGR